MTQEVLCVGMLIVDFINAAAPTTASLSGTSEIGV
jgi:hypothetical protein